MTARIPITEKDIGLLKKAYNDGVSREVFDYRFRALGDYRLTVSICSNSSDKARPGVTTLIRVQKWMGHVYSTQYFERLQDAIEAVKAW